jgi:tetratricopeptide (TPR) repeat protein
VHPLHVESVAWIAERKDVLSGFFFILALGAYTRYARSGAKAWYFVVAGLFVLGLMAKPMVMTLPGVLFLIDYYPLKRVARARDLVIEKLPFVGLAIVCAIVTFVAQHAARAVRTFGQFPLSFRLSNAIVSVGRYLLKTVWPMDMTVFYPAPPRWSVLAVAANAIVIVAITALAIRRRREQPYLLMGWLWFLGMLLPVIGIVQVGRQAMADRYTYLPHIGLFVAIVWGLADIAAHGKALRQAFGALGVVAIAGLSITSFVQVQHWQSTETLFTHALLVSDDNVVALNQIGNVHAKQRDIAAAEKLYREAVRIDPDYALAQQNLANVLVRQRRFSEAAEHYRAALVGRLPETAKTTFGLGQALRGMGDFDGAERAFADALALDPRLPQAQFAWGELLREQKRAIDAAEHYRAALAIDPNFAMARSALDSLNLSATRPASQP